MKKGIDGLKKNIGLGFLVVMVPFIILAILSIWDFVGAEVVWKSVSTIAVLVVSTLLAVGIISLVNYKE